MKVLMSAYACEPGKGSEPGAGWAWTRAAALNHEVWVLTRENNRSAIEAALAEEPELNFHPVYLDLPKWARWWKRGQRGVRLYYILWQWRARRLARVLHAEQRFDVAHHITFAMDSMPAGVVGVRGLPSVWGPVGGTAPFPWAFRKWLGIRGIMREGARSVASGTLRCLFGMRTAHQASLVVAQNEDVARRFPVDRIVVEPNVAIDESVFAGTSRRGSVNGPTAVYCGRLVAFKGIGLAIAALAEPAVANWHLRVFGDGPDRNAAKRYANVLGVEDRVTFEGLVERTAVADGLRSADCLLFPSMHDAAGWAVGEAIAAGLPVVCFDVGGPPVLLKRTGGGFVANHGLRAPAELAHGMCTALPPSTSEAVLARRLPATITSWYSTAIAQNGSELGARQRP